MSKVFVYGTLRTGGPYHYLISALVKSRTPAWVKGWMFDLGDYPAIVDGSGIVFGEILEFENPQEAIRRMDRFEGYQGPDQRENEFERVETEAMLKGGQTEKVQVYQYSQQENAALAENYPLIISGEWLKRNSGDEWLAYFAYGSCMDRSSFAEDVPEFHVAGRAELPGYKVAFTRKSVIDGSGKADVVEQPGEVTEGVLYLIPAHSLDSLDCREGAAAHLLNPAYRRKDVVVGIDGMQIQAFTYEVVNKELREIPPSQEYADTILRGADLE